MEGVFVINACTSNSEPRTGVCQNIFDSLQKPQFTCTQDTLNRSFPKNT